MLCWMDSDNDTRSNGVELGDENCTWTFGNPSTTPESHPGVYNIHSSIIMHVTILLTQTMCIFICYGNGSYHRK